MRTTLLGTCSTPPATTSPAAPSASPCSSPAASTCRGPATECGRRPRRRLRGRSPGPGLRAAPDRLRSPSGRSRSPAGAARARTADFYALKGAARAALRGSSAPRSLSSRREEPFLHPGRARPRSLIGGVDAGWIGELHPLVCRAWDLDGGGRLRDRPGRCWSRRRRPGSSSYEDVTSYPAVHEDLAVVVRRRVAAARGRRGRGPRAAASCCARPRLRRLRGRAGRRGPQEPRPAARVPRARPDPHRRGGRRAPRRDHRGASAGLGGVSSVQPLTASRRSRVIVAGASGFAGALAAELVWRHPAPRARRGDLALRRRHAARRALPALPGRRSS